MISIRDLGIQPYAMVWDEMKQLTISRHDKTPDELWLVEHYPVYTQGQAGKPEHVLNARNIPIIQSDRGGQVTYHGPGQLVAYVLLDLRRKNMGIRTLVSQLEAVLMALLLKYEIKSAVKCGAPGVYVDDKKIASIGLRVKNGCTYHGIALNVAMDLTPFDGINPCGFAKMPMAQMQDFIADISLEQVKNEFIHQFFNLFEK